MIDIRSTKSRYGNGTRPQTDVTPEASSNISSPEEQIGEKELASSGALDGLEQAVIGQYLEYLEKRGIRREDLAVILDTLIATGNVSYSCKILGRIEIELVMRSTAMNESITRRLDEEFAGRQDVSVMRYSNRQAILNLAASLRRHGNDSYSVTTEEELDAAIQRILALPYVVSSAMVEQLAVFDRALAVATSSWGIKNFTGPGSAD